MSALTDADVARKTGEQLGRFLAARIEPIPEEQRAFQDVRGWWWLVWDGLSPERRAQYVEAARWVVDDLCRALDGYGPVETRWGQPALQHLSHVIAVHVQEPPGHSRAREPELQQRYLDAAADLARVVLQRPRSWQDALHWPPRRRSVWDVLAEFFGGR